MFRLVWCSAHTPTDEQKKSLLSSGSLLYLSDIDVRLLDRLSNSPDNRRELETLVIQLTSLLSRLSYDDDGVYTPTVAIQPAGSPAFQMMFGAYLQSIDRLDQVLYAHSERVSEDIVQPDGSVKKISVFKHLGWV
jgi:hypothetical protein